MRKSIGIEEGSQLYRFPFFGVRLYAEWNIHNWFHLFFLTFPIRFDIGLSSDNRFFLEDLIGGIVWLRIALRVYALVEAELQIKLPVFWIPLKVLKVDMDEHFNH